MSTPRNLTSSPVTAEDIRTWPASVDVPKACKAIGVSKSTGYDLVARGEFPARVLKVGGRYRVVTASLARLLEVDLAD